MYLFDMTFNTACGLLIFKINVFKELAILRYYIESLQSHGWTKIIYGKVIIRAHACLYGTHLVWASTVNF